MSSPAARPSVRDWTRSWTRSRQARSSVLVTRRIDRIGRDTRDNLALFDVFLDAGSALHEYQGGRRLTRDDRFIYTIESAVAERESDKISQRVSGTAAARLQGYFPGGRFRPYGYRREPLPDKKRSRSS